LLSLGNIHFYQDDLEQAQKYYRGALEIQQHIDDIRGIIGARHNLGLVMELGGDWPGATDEYVGALELTRRLGGMSQQVELELSLGILQTKQGDLDAALSHLSRCLSLARDNHLQVHLIYARSSLADLYIRLRAWEQAEAALDDAERLSRELNKRDQLPEVYRNRALLRLAQGEEARALADAQQAIRLAGDIGTQLEEGASLRVLGQTLLALGRLEEALAAFERSFELLDAKDPYEAARTAFQWGHALGVSRKADQGRRLLQQARATFQRLGARLDLANLDALVASGG
jgi:tetratricopeptide (TPR) repeat protein